MSIERLCEVMHDAYENAATDTGWQTQEVSRKPWSEVPEANKATMRAAVRAIVPLICAEALREAAKLLTKGANWPYDPASYLTKLADAKEAGR